MLPPDWSADWLHRESMAQLDQFAQAEGKAGYGAIPEPEHGAAAGRPAAGNAFQQLGDPATDSIKINEQRAAAIDLVGRHYLDLFTGRTARARELRALYAFPAYATLRPDEAQAAQRIHFLDGLGHDYEPAERYRYLHQQLAARAAGRQHSDRITFPVDLLSILVLLAGIGAIVWYYAREFDIWRRDGVPEGGFAKTDLPTEVTDHSLDARYPQVFRGGHTHVPRADRRRHRDGSLCG